MSEHKTLAEALLAFQADPPEIRKTGENKAFKKPDGSPSKFVSLDALMDAVLPALNEHGLVWMTMPRRAEDGQSTLAYKLLHVTSSQFVEDQMPLSIPLNATPQQQGSAITYARRYSMMAVLGLVGDEDDDGNASSQAPRGAVRLNGDRPRVLQAPERARMIKAVEDAGENLQLVLAAVGAGAHGELTVEDAKNVKAHLDKLQELTL